MTHTPIAGDVIDLSLDLTPAHPLHALRRQRLKIVDATQGSYLAMFAEPVTDLSVVERQLIALHACHHAGASGLADWYRHSLQAAGVSAALIAQADGQGDAQGPAADSRLQALLAYTAQVTRKPIDGDERAVQALQVQGLKARDIVALGQLIAFVAYQVRLHAGLRAMAAAGLADVQVPADEAAAAAGAAGATGAAATAVQPPSLPNPLRICGFTNEVLDWRAWVAPVPLEEASVAQMAALNAMNATAKDQAYFRLLAHQPEMLVQRSIAYNAIMFAPGGLPRAERELAATVESRLNGCVYCASVHAQRHEQLTKGNALMAAVFSNPATAGTHPRERLIVRFSTVLGLTPAELDARLVLEARAAGLDDAQVLDLIHAVAVFAWANRLMLNLGEPVHLDGRPAEKGQP